MTDYNPYRGECTLPTVKKNDVLVVFGEVFQRGYVNGLIDAALAQGAKVVYSTMGRRDSDGTLRALTPEEVKEKAQSPFINVPLEAGFDLEPAGVNGPSPVEQLRGLKMSQWQEANLDWDLVEKSRLAGESRFRAQVVTFLRELENHIDDDSNVVFAHTMAGGFPRAKVIMPVANRVFKGTGDRYSSSQEFWESTLGRLCDISFKEVTAETFRHLIELSTPLRENIESRGQRVSYLAYGYHGTEVLRNGEYVWQSYSPYLQGFAKLRLEDIAKEAWQSDIKASVFNAPEILTNSSSIFLGVEVALYPLIGALKKDAPQTAKKEELFKHCQSLLKSEYTLEDIYRRTQEYLNNEVVKNWPQFSNWPQHNGPEQMELMRTSSQDLIDMHQDSKNLMTAPLSEVVFQACGKVMWSEAFAPKAPVWWIGHDAVAVNTGN